MFQPGPNSPLGKSRTPCGLFPHLLRDEGIAPDSLHGLCALKCCSSEPMGPWLRRSKLAHPTPFLYSL